MPGLRLSLAIALDDLPGPLDPTRYPIVSTLCQRGTRGLFDAARRDDGFSPRATGYVSRCALCDHIHRHLVAHRPHPSPELQPPGFYT